MNKSAVPEYIIPQVNFQSYQLFFISLLVLIPNIYFFYRSMTYKSFNERKIFKYMTMVLSFELIFSCLVHIFFNAYLYVHYYSKFKAHLNTCAKISILDININQILIVTPFYFNIFRCYKVIFNKNPNPIVMIIAFLITMGPLLYMMTGQYFEINIYYQVRFDCRYQIFSDIPYYQFFLYSNMVMLLFVPFFSFLLNYLIYRRAIHSTSITNKRKIKEHHGLFRGIAIQSIFPFFCQLPGILYHIYFLISKLFFTVFMK